MAGPAVLSVPWETGLCGISGVRPGERAGASWLGHGPRGLPAAGSGPDPHAQCPSVDPDAQARALGRVIRDMVPTPHPGLSLVREFTRGSLVAAFRAFRGNSQKVNLILNIFLNPFPGGGDQFAFLLSLRSHRGWYFARAAGVFHVLSLHSRDPRSLFCDTGSRLKARGGSASGCPFVPVSVGAHCSGHSRARAR